MKIGKGIEVNEMKKINLIALPCICADVFDGTDIIRPGGEALNFAAHASKFDNISVTLLGIVGNDMYAEKIIASVADMKISTKYIRTDTRYATAHNKTYLTPNGDRYYKEDSWDGRILDNIILNDTEISLMADADIVFIHFWASCFKQVIELKKVYGFKLAVDFDVYRDFDDMKQYASFIDFFMISGSEELLHYFEELSNCYDGLFNMTLAERGNVTYCKGKKYQAAAVRVKEVVDTTGCGDSYHAGFVCSYMIEKDIRKAMTVGSEFAAETLTHHGGF